MANTELTLQKEISPIVTKAQSFQITDESSMTQAVELLSQANSYADKIEEERMKVMRPLLDAQKAENARWAALKSPLAIVIATMRAKISTYQTERTRIIEAQKALIEARVGSGRGKLSLDTATKRLEAIEEPTARVTTHAGSLSFKETRTLKITDTALLPREYLIPNEKLLLTELKSGKKIPGAEIEVLQIPINRR